METLVENAQGGEATLAAELLNVPVDQIEFKDRARKAYKDLQSLVKMFREKGIIHPIAVQRQDDTVFPFKLLAGGRRYSAAVLGGFKEIPCRVYPSNLDDLDRREIELMENLGREALDWREEVWLTEEIHRLQTEKHERNNVGTAAPAYTAADTARLMKATPMSVSRDRQLAEGLSQHRDVLAGAKNKSEAARLLKKLDRDKHHKAAANALQESLAKDSGENIKRTISNGYIVGDFFEGVKNVPNMAVTMVELDPPYGIDLHNRTNNTDFGMREYNEVKIAEYPEFMKRVLTECFRVLSTDGWIVVWHGFQWYHMLMETLAVVGFDPHHIPASWVKLDNPGQTKQPDLNLGSAHEPFIYARKGKPYIQTPGRNNLFAYKTLFPDWKIHPTERPIELVQDVFRTFCHPQGRVMIPFLGSGNSILAASNLNLGCFGWDLSDVYKTGFLARVAEGTPGSYKSYKG